MSNYRDVECMSLALRLAKRGQYTTRPNPNVGCVITNRDGDIVGTGFHARAGEPHAEIMALQQAGEHAADGTAYVTLEPCCHQGRTGPCTQALLDAKLHRVVIAMKDPNPLVTGKGIKQLEDNGINVSTGLADEQAKKLNPGFIKRMTLGLPWVTVKMATSMDGRTALNNRQSKWITSESARLDVQKLRARHDAILTGIGTITADDPSLNVRLDSQQLRIEGSVIQPYRVIIDPKLEITAHAKVFNVSGQVIIFTEENNETGILDKMNNCRIFTLPANQGRFELKKVLEKLATLEINSVLIEAGAGLAGEFFNARCVDELIHYTSPKLMGNLSKGMLDIEEIKQMDDCITLDYSDIRQIGHDLKITSKVNY